MKRLLGLIVTTLLLLAGCVGGGPVLTNTTTKQVAQPNSKYENFCPSAEVGQLLACKDNVDLSKQAFVRAWGEPKSRVIRDGKEILTYNKDIAWRGLVVFAILPIPLMLPVGHNEIMLHFQSDKLVQVDYEYGYGSYAICGLHSEGPNGFGCVIWH